MPPANAPLRILERIEESIATMQRDMNGMRQEMNARLLDVEQHVVAHTEILAALNDQLGFFERAAMTANHARVRLVPPDDPVTARVLVIEQQRGRPDLTTLPTTLDDEPA